MSLQSEECLQDVLGKETFNDAVKAAVAEAYFFLADVFIAKEGDLRREHEAGAGGWSGWRRLRLVERVKESPLHSSLILAAEDDLPLAEYQPGQYISVRVPGEAVPGGGEYSHCRNYSLSDSPRTDRYRITVKRETGTFKLFTIFFSRS